jgi:hypothetical protein
MIILGWLLFIFMIIYLKALGRLGQRRKNLGESARFSRFGAAFCRLTRQSFLSAGFSA